jgi:hypothetical protein
LPLLSRSFTTLIMPPLFFALLIFWIGSCVCAQAHLCCDPLICTSHINGMTDVHHEAQLSLMGSC